MGTRKRGKNQDRKKQTTFSVHRELQAYVFVQKSMRLHLAVVGRKRSSVRFSLGLALSFQYLPPPFVPAVLPRAPTVVVKPPA